MLQRLTTALFQEKASNTSESLLNEMRQITHLLYQINEKIKKGI